MPQTADSCFSYARDAELASKHFKDMAKVYYFIF